MSDDIFIGQIIHWSSTVIPENWQICDGTGGTPDLRGLFIYGRSTDAETPLTGGATTHGHTGGITSSAGGTHGHGDASGNTNEEGGDSTTGGVATASTTHSHSVSVGIDDASDAHTHGTDVVDATALPTYITLYYIMKVA